MMYWSDRTQRVASLQKRLQWNMNLCWQLTWLVPALQRGEDVVEQDRCHGVVDGHLDSAPGAELWTDDAADVRQPSPP